MNLTIEDVGPCRKLLRFELDADTVKAGFEHVEKEYLKHAAIPGFRPGKAPAEMVLKRHEKEIQDEAKSKLISENYKAGVAGKNLSVLRILNVEEVHCAKGEPMQFLVTVEVQPQFELPQYRGLPARREQAVVTEQDIERALRALQEQRATFLQVNRAAREGDVVVVNYTGTCDGKPITELSPASRGLAEQKNFWIELRKDAFLPGFAEQLLGATPGEQRTVQVQFPAQFSIAPLAGKQAVYQVELLRVQERVLPPLDEAFARSWEAETLEKLREGVRADLQNELNQKIKRSIRNQIVRALLDRVSFELPESYVQEETRDVVYDIVTDSQQRGVAKETIERQKDEIYAMATRSAQERVKAGFLFQRIAEKEGIRVPPEAINARVALLARAANKPVQQFVKELEKSGGLTRLVEELLREAVVDFLQEHARIEDVAPSPAPAPAPPG